MINQALALVYLDGLIANSKKNKKNATHTAELVNLRALLTEDSLPSTSSEIHSGLRPVKMGLYPTMGSLQQVVDLAISQLPYTSPNSVIGLLMTYQNTLLHELEKVKQ